MFVVTVLLSVREVNSKCPFSSGKTLDVYYNNCIGFYRHLPDAQRRLLLYTCGNNVNSETNKERLSCILPDTSLTTGQWIKSC